MFMLVCVCLFPSSRAYVVMIARQDYGDATNKANLKDVYLKQNGGLVIIMGDAVGYGLNLLNFLLDDAATNYANCSSSGTSIHTEAENIAYRTFDFTDAPRGVVAADLPSQIPTSNANVFEINCTSSFDFYRRQFYGPSVLSSWNLGEGVVMYFAYDWCVATCSEFEC